MKGILENGKISGYQLFLLLLTTVLATGILFVPGITARSAGHDGWLSLLIVATIPGLMTAEICSKLAMRFPEKTIIQYSEEILGKYFGKFLGLLFIFYIVLINSIIIKEGSSFITSAFLARTPPVVISGALMLLAVYMVRDGIEVISRVNEITIILFFIIFILIFALISSEMNLNNLLPINDKGIKAIILGGLPPSVWRTEVVVMAFIIPFVKAPSKVRKISIGAVLFLAIFLAIDNIMSSAVLGDLIAVESFPFLSLVRYISLGDFIDRVESVIMVFWVSGVLIKITVFYYGAVICTAQLFKLKDYKPVVLPMGVILLVWSLTILKSSPELLKFISTTSVTMGWTMVVLFPLFLLIMAVITGKGVVKKK